MDEGKKYKEDEDEIEWLRAPRADVPSNPEMGSGVGGLMRQQHNCRCDFDACYIDKLLKMIGRCTLIMRSQLTAQQWSKACPGHRNGHRYARPKTCHVMSYRDRVPGIRQAFATLSDPFLKGTPLGFIVFFSPLPTRFTTASETHDSVEALSYSHPWTG
jgi:hypothetical protein